MNDSTAGQLMIATLAFFFGLVMGMAFLFLHRRYLMYQFKERLHDETEKAREDALTKSRATMKGAIGEQMAPLLGVFTERFKPSEAKFIGAPIDYVIFENIDMVGAPDSGPVVVWFVEVKTGDAGLTERERKIQEAVEKGAVRFDVLRLPV